MKRRSILETVFKYLWSIVFVWLFCFFAWMLFVYNNRVELDEVIQRQKTTFLDKEVEIAVKNWERLEYKKYFVSNYEKDFVGIETLTLHPVGDETEDWHYIEACAEEYGCNTIIMSVDEFKKLFVKKK